MRNAFVRALMREAAADPQLILVTGDLGFGVLKPFWEAYPKQFVNAGIAEQAMTGLAAGLAREGHRVVNYSIGNFPTLRCIEQIRNDCAYHDADVKIVCVGGGFVYGSLGMSHHATEDIAMMRALPGVRVYAPGAGIEAEACVADMMNTKGTCYLRLGRGGEPVMHDAPLTDWQAPKALTLREGRDVALLSAGGILAETAGAADLLAAKGISAEVVSFPSVKPIDSGKIAELAKRFPLIVSCEEHSIVGGFGSAVAEELSALGTPCRLMRIGMQDAYTTAVGSQQYLRRTYGMDAAAIAEKTLGWLG